MFDKFLEYLFHNRQTMALKFDMLKDVSIKHFPKNCYDGQWALMRRFQGCCWIRNPLYTKQNHTSTHRWAILFSRRLSLLTIAFETCNISSKRDSSCLCRPLVSTMMISNPSFLNISTPSWAITTGSTSV